MHVTGKQIAMGVGIVAGAVGIAALLSACSPKEQDADTFLLDKFDGFDRNPKDNKWGAGETSITYRPTTRTREVNTYRVGDYIFGTRQIIQSQRTNSMQRIYEAARGNDAIVSLEEMRNFALQRFDADANGTLNRSERNKFDDQYGPLTRTRQQTIGSEGFSRYSPIDDYPRNPGGGGGQTSPGDDYGGGYNPGNGGGSTSPGDDGGGYVPPSSGGGTGGGTSPGDSGGYTPPSSGGGSGGSSGSGNSTDNGNPSDDDF